MPKRLWIFLCALLIPAIMGIILVDEKSPEAAPVAQTVAIATSSAEVIAPIVNEQKIDTNALVTRAVDGDTFVAVLDSEKGEWKVRMLGINTPESVDPRKPVECFGKEASQKLSDLLAGKRVRLEPDPQADERDKYGRLLRNVFLENGIDVNALMVREGFAYAYLTYPLDRARKSELKKLQEEAKLNFTGLWATSTCAVI